MPSSNTSQHGLTFGIAGAGIAGLAAAIALRQHGHEAVIFEKAPAFEPVGAGIGITPNGMRMLDVLGAGRETRARGVRLKVVELRTSSGRTLHRLDLGRVEEQLGAPSIAIHRADLHQVLLRALPDSIVRAGSEVQSFHETASGVTVSLAGGTEHEVNALIGADGIHSTVRGLLHGHEEPQYAGYAAWRGVSETPSQVIGYNRSIEIWARGARFGAVPIGTGRIYWWLAAKFDDPHAPGLRDLKAAALLLCAKWKGPAAELVSATPADSISWLPIYDRPLPVRWGRGLITLIGDAAHPVTPNLAQGASLALEDAVALAEFCKDACNAEQVREAFRSFESRRAERVSHIVRLSHRFGRAGQLDWLPAVWLRNLITRLTPEPITRRQFVSLVEPGMR